MFSSDIIYTREWQNKKKTRMNKVNDLCTELKKSSKTLQDILSNTNFIITGYQQLFTLPPNYKLEYLGGLLLLSSKINTNAIAIQGDISRS